jgi:periplasmic divalent cation tolerance protein
VSEDYCEVIITADNADWLADYTRRLVADRLAACGHNIAPIRSIYRWEGAVQDEAEARVALHTRASLVPAIIDRTNAEHPYDVPCVIALPIGQGNPAYLEWVKESTREALSGTRES